MSDLIFSQLDTQNPDEAALFERSLFRAFYPLNDPAVSLIWDIDCAERRIHMKIPYSAQEIFIARWHGTIIAGAALNFDMSAQLQLEMLGFSIDKTLPGICEGLAIFSLQALAGEIPVMLRLGEVIQTALTRKNIVKAYGTCSQKLLRGYQVLGFRAIDCQKVKNSKEYLLETQISTRYNGFHPE